MAKNGAMPGSRRLLARLRDVMASSGSPQERLDGIVTTIAMDFVAEVCSVYVLRAGEVLELFAATGLSRESIHTTRLSIGEGLIGAIASQARPMVLEDAQAHPAFVYRPETGEEIYHSLAGVPVLRGGRVTGVLAVQNQTRRHYTEDEVETLETIAMVVAELIAGGGLISPDERQAVYGAALLPATLVGIRLNGGLAMGQAVLHEREVAITKLVADEPRAEIIRLEQAMAEMHGAIDAMLEASDVAIGGEHRDILETYRMFAEDAGWLARITEAINTGLTAEAAVEKVRNDTRARFRKNTDPYFRERLHDFNDLANRLLHHLVEPVSDTAAKDLPSDLILFARNMGPAELLDYDRTRLRALVLEGGSATTHVAIVARALDIPVVGRVSDALDRVEELDTVIVDGDNASICIRPAIDTRNTYVDMLSAWAQRKAAYTAIKDVPAETKDGARIALDINAGLVADMQQLEETGADGVGLYRTEIPFMNSSDFPGVDRQAEIYKRVMDAAAGKPVTFRTLDIGGDKNLPYWHTGTEENPAMGWRAVRIALDRPVLMRHQFRALIKAAEGQELRLMFPMITEVSEFDAARNLLDRELSRAKTRGRPIPEKLFVGTMLEVPALAFQLPVLLKRADFISVGSNDLFQFLFASDRGSPHLADRYDSLSPAALFFLQYLVDSCDKTNTPLTLCGEIAGRPLEAMALIGIGFRRLSMSPGSIGPVKTMIRSLSAGDLTRYIESLGDHAEHSFRKKLRQFAVDHGVMI